MAWLYGIPDVSFSNHFVYFYNLLEDDGSHNTIRGYERKREVGWQALIDYTENMRALKGAETQINDAVDFILKVAQSERAKEIAAVRAYYKKIEKALPIEESHFSEEYIMKNPEKFYTELTAEINKSRMALEDYKRELQRILDNVNGAKEKLSDYFKDDYRYRIAGDIQSMLKKMRGDFRENDKTVQTFNQKIQEMAVEITNEMIGDKMAKGEDFAAIASAVLIELEMRAQHMMDFSKQSGVKVDDLSKLEDEVLKELKGNYLKQLESSKEQERTGVQNALLNIDSAGFLRITENVKKIFGLNMLDKESKEYQKQYKAILDKAKQRSKDTKDARGAIRNIRGKMSKVRANQMYGLDFETKEGKSVHGDLFELVKTIIEENGIKAGRYAATDVLSISCSWKIKPNDAFIDEILNDIGNEMSAVLENEINKEGSNEKDLRKAVTQMSENIEQSIKKLDARLKRLNKNDIGEFFVFHESLKLYSSVETGAYKKWGGHAGFGGRTMNILSYIDYMSEALDTAGLSTPVDRDTLAFLGLNLANNAIGQGYDEPLAKYFSIFAGLLMFDDIVNMTKEALGKMETSSVKQVHLYNLNGVYVPASMVLSYVGDALQVGAAEASYAATASITSTEAAKAISEWKIKQSEENFHPILGPAEWNEMGSKVASGTKVKIAFMGAFIHFINKLAEVK